MEEIRRSCVDCRAGGCNKKEVPVTTLVAKDRVLGHNTVAAIYQADKYYEKKLFPAE